MNSWTKYYRDCTEIFVFFELIFSVSPYRISLEIDIDDTVVGRIGYLRDDIEHSEEVNFDVTA